MKKRDIGVWFIIRNFGPEIILTGNTAIDI